MFKTLKIGNHNVSSNVLLAPMTGVSDKPFRKMVKKFGVGLVFSEMIASQAMIRQTRQSMRMILKDNDCDIMAVQLAGCEPEVMAEAAKLNIDLGAQIIDINMGCPVKKIVNGHAGSALMKNELLAAKIIEATIKSVDVPVTLKMRTGWDHNNRNAPKLAKIAQDLGIKMITIHGRTRCQLYSGKADWGFVRQIKELSKVPVIVNGDITSHQDCVDALEQSGADGVMIGRGSYGRPWFLNQAQYFLKNKQALKDPNYDEQRQVILEHFEDILSLYGIEAGVKIARKHLSWYSKGFYNCAQYRVNINQSECPKQIKQYIDELFKEEINYINTKS